MAFKGLNDNKVTIECGLSVGLLGKARSGKSDLGEKAIEKILNIYQDLSHVWLLTGEGSMLKTTDQPVSQGGEDATLSDADLNNSNTMKKYLDQVLRQNEELIRQNGVLLDLFREERAKNKGEVALKKEG